MKRVKFFPTKKIKINNSILSGGFIIINLHYKNKEFLYYVFWGAMTTIVNYICYFVFTGFFNIYYILSNFISWVITVVFAFLVNKLFVFYSKKIDFSTVLKEFSYFILSRLISLAVETIILFSIVDILKIDDFYGKTVAFIVVVFLNYILSKFMVFKKN